MIQWYISSLRHFTVRTYIVGDYYFSVVVSVYRLCLLYLLTPSSQFSTIFWLYRAHDDIIVAVAVAATAAVAAATDVATAADAAIDVADVAVSVADAAIAIAAAAA